MDLFVIVVGIFFTLLSVTILSYVSIATMLGPWIAPTLVLIGSGLSRLRGGNKSPGQLNQQLLLTQAIGAGGGAIATGVGFALPILYFLDPPTFNRGLADPMRFCILISAGCISAGSYGIFLGRLFAHNIIQEERLPFPVSQLTYNVVTSQSRSKQAKNLFTGVGATIFLSFLRDGALGFKGVLPRTFYLFEAFCGQVFALSLWPTLWAIGFTTGLVVVLPLVVGVLSKYLILYPLNVHSLYLPFQLFPVLKDETFVTAFCSGLVVAELLIGIIKKPTALFGKIKHYASGLVRGGGKLYDFAFKQDREHWKEFTSTSLISRTLQIIEPVFVLVASMAFFSYLNFPLAAQLVLFLLIAIATYEISYIGCEIGLVQFGRFSAFVLIPMLFLFKLNFVQLTALCVFFNICAAAASDLLFDYKTGSFCDIEKSKLHIAQWIGLLVTSLSIGFILYVLFTSFKLGSADLFAQRGRSKALLIQSLNFDYYVVSLGFLYGVILKKCCISPTMAFGGIIMPNNITIGLLIGSISSYFVEKKEDYLPFCSGVFASESLWIIISTALKLF